MQKIKDRRLMIEARAILSIFGLRSLVFGPPASSRHARSSSFDNPFHFGEGSG
jgi:hypothetical protein